MSSRPLTSRAIDELLIAVHEELEDGAEVARIRALADANPDARAEILGFAAEWFASEGGDLPDEVLDTGHTAREHATLLERYHESGLAEGASALHGVPYEKLQEVAGRCRIDPDLLRQLARGRIEGLSIPGILIGWLGLELGADADAVLCAIDPARPSAQVDYFAPSGRKQASRISFLEAVRSSKLNQGDREFWLGKLER